MTPTQLTLRHVRGLGYLAEVTEHWNSHARVRNDLFGFVDVLAIGCGETIGIQTTSAPNVAARINKIADSPHIGRLREAGWRIVVHGWAKKSGRWVLTREVDVS